MIVSVVVSVTVLTCDIQIMHSNKQRYCVRIGEFKTANPAETPPSNELATLVRTRTPTSVAESNSFFDTSISTDE